MIIWCRGPTSPLGSRIRIRITPPITCRRPALTATVRADVLKTSQAGFPCSAADRHARHMCEKNPVIWVPTVNRAHFRLGLSR